MIGGRTSFKSLKPSLLYVVSTSEANTVGDEMKTVRCFIEFNNVVFCGNKYIPSSSSKSARDHNEQDGNLILRIM